MEQRVRAAFERLGAGGPEAIHDLLDPEVEMLAPRPGPWDCHGREAVLRFLWGWLAGGPAVEIIEVRDFGDRLLLGLRRADPEGGVSDHYSVLTLRDGRLRSMRGQPSRAAALVAIYGAAIGGLPSRAPRPDGDRVYVGGPFGGDRQRARDLPDQIDLPGGTYVRSPACADDGLVRYVWREERAPGGRPFEGPMDRA